MNGSAEASCRYRMGHYETAMSTYDSLLSETKDSDALEEVYADSIIGMIDYANDLQLRTNYLACAVSGARAVQGLNKLKGISHQTYTVAH